MIKYIIASIVLFVTGLAGTGQCVHSQTSGYIADSQNHRRLQPGIFRPDIRAILIQQANRQFKGQAKPTSGEVLVAQTSEYEGTSSHFIDSFSYSYSGGRGSNLGSDIIAYDDRYSPLTPPSPDSYTFCTTVPHILYDTVNRYVTAYNNPPRLGAKTYQTFDVNNNIDSTVSVTVQTDGSFAYSKLHAVTYNAQGHIEYGRKYEDVSWPLSGAYVLLQQAHVLYDNDRRVQDTVMELTNAGILYVQVINYHHNSAGLIDTISSDYLDNTTATWENNQYTSYNYDGLGRLVYARNEQWNGSDWVLGKIDTFGYEGAYQSYVYYEQRYPDSTGFDSYFETATLNSFGAWDSVRRADNSSGILIEHGEYALTYNSNMHVTSYAGVTDGSPVIRRFYYSPAAGTENVFHTGKAPFAVLLPNPVHDRATIAVSNPQGNICLTVNNMTGQLLYEQHSPAVGALDINTATLPAGIYHVVLRMGDAIQTLKLIKE